MRTLVRLTVVILLAALGAGCARPAAGVRVTGPGWQATITTVPWPPRGITAHHVIVTFDNTTGLPRTITLQASMPGMGHGPTSVVLQASAPGRYEGDVTFEMAGTWTVALLVGSPPRRGAATFTVQP